MHLAVYEELKRVARAQKTVTYSQIAPLADLDMSNAAHRQDIARILGEISTCEYKKGQPMLSAVVVLRDKNIPGHGFFTLAKELGVYAGNDDQVFWCQELSRVHQAWQEL